MHGLLQADRIVRSKKFVRGARPRSSTGFFALVAPDHSYHRYALEVRLREIMEMRVLVAGGTGAGSVHRAGLSS